MKSFLHRLKTDRKTQALMGISVLALIFIAVIVFFFVQSNRPDLDIEDVVSNTIGQDGEYRKLDGVVIVDGGLTDEFPRAVMVENLVSVRPQTGLTRAGVVYEALAEGGITRFMAVYGGENADKIGPVRSARPYFVDIASEYSALYTHAGGSPDALSRIGDSEVVDLNQIGGDQAYFWRDSALRAPHNLFTKSEFLTFALRDKDILDEKASYLGWSFEDEVSLDERSDSAQEIEIDFSTKNYSVMYVYDNEENVYRRFNGGKAHVDELTGEHIQPKNVIIQYVEQRIVDDEGRLDISVVGEGDAIIFNNGKAVKGSWEKKDAESRTQFTDNEGNGVSLTRGQTWVELVPKNNEVIY